MSKQITWTDVVAHARRDSQLVWGSLPDAEVVFTYLRHVERQRDQARHECDELQREATALRGELRRLAATPTTGKAQLRADLAALTERIDEIERRMAL